MVLTVTKKKKKVIIKRGVEITTHGIKTGVTLWKLPKKKRVKENYLVKDE